MASHYSQCRTQRTKRKMRTWMMIQTRRLLFCTEKLSAWPKPLSTGSKRNTKKLQSTLRSQSAKPAAALRITHIHIVHLAAACPKLNNLIHLRVPRTPSYSSSPKRGYWFAERPHEYVCGSQVSTYMLSVSHGFCIQTKRSANSGHWF